MFFEAITDGYAITAYYALSLKQFSMEPHQHESAEIMYVESGQCTVCIQNKCLLLPERSFIFIDSFIPHSLTIDSACTILNLELTHNKADFTWQDLKNLTHWPQFINKCSPYYLGKDTKQLGQTLTEIIQLQTTKNNDDQLLKSENHYLKQLLFSRFWLELLLITQTKQPNPGISYLKVAMRYIEQHFEEDLCLPDVAAVAGIHKSYLQHLLNVYEQTSFSGFLNQKRLEKAAFLLINTHTSITDIAFQVGYNSRQYFTQIFAKHFQTSPKNYRKLHHSMTGNGQVRLDQNGHWQVIAMK